MNDIPYSTGDGRTAVIRFDDDEQITIHDPDGRQIGYVTHREVDQDHHGSSVVYVTHVDIDPLWRRQGIMREAVRILAEEYGYSVLARQNDGIPREDGSHLVGDGPAFFDALEKAKIISRF